MNNKLAILGFFMSGLLGAGAVFYLGMPHCTSAQLVPTTRIANFQIDPLLLHRWSPRAMSGEALTDVELNTLFEAARWAPSSYNEQPWRFIYAKRNSSYWQQLFDQLVPFNQQWAKNASALVVIISKNSFSHNNEPAQTHSFDTGAAWENLALQATAMNLIAHGIAGFDYEKAKQVLKIPDGYTVEAMVAIGKPGSIEQLPESMRKDHKPSGRKPLRELIAEGTFQPNLV